MRKKGIYLFCSLVIFIIAVTACSKKKDQAPQPQAEQQTEQQQQKPREIKPLLSTHGASRTTVEPSAAAKADVKETQAVIPAKQVAQPEGKINEVNPLQGEAKGPGGSP